MGEKTKEKNLVFNNDSTTAGQLYEWAKNIKHFRGVYMIDGLPRRPYKIEYAIVNL